MASSQRHRICGLFYLFHFSNLSNNDALVKGSMMTCFVFCYSITRRRTDPVEGQFTSLTVPERRLAAIQRNSFHTLVCLFFF